MTLTYSKIILNLLLRFWYYRSRWVDYKEGEVGYNLVQLEKARSVSKRSVAPH